MARTSITFSETLHQRLLFASRTIGKPVSDLIREAVTTDLAKREEAQRDRMYRALDQIRGIAEAADSDTSSTIDETLYGEQGVWRGAHEK